MKAIQVSSFGAPEVLRLTELPDAAPGPGEVAVDVTHAAVGLIDVSIRQGLASTVPGADSRRATCPGRTERPGNSGQYRDRIKPRYAHDGGYRSSSGARRNYSA